MYDVDVLEGGSISFAECTMGLSFILPRDIRLPRFDVTIEGCPEFLDIAYKFLDYHTNFDENRGTLMKAGICKVHGYFFLKFLRCPSSVRNTC